MLAQVTRHLDQSRYEIGADVDYPASIGPMNPQKRIDGCSEDFSVAAGVDALATAVRAAKYPVGLLGYSLGAIVVSRFLEAKARGEFPECDVLWAANIANPLRRCGDSLLGDPGGFGINGEHGPWPSDVRTWEVAHAADGITCCPADSPLRALADGVSAFSFAELGGWTSGLAERFRANRWQLTLHAWSRGPLREWRQWSTAATLIDGYVRGGQHNAVYREAGYCYRLAAVINAFE
ncbi:PE-PPE domain-containing protein [Nocardia sp. NPDC058666]|uniref:PE-PPE domain-containing protein n=1 Tax=unclassified Nocardia TaxID=2637762 RepID=UPI003656A7EE